MRKTTVKTVHVTDTSLSIIKGTLASLSVLCEDALSSFQVMQNHARLSPNIWPREECHIWENHNMNFSQMKPGDILFRLVVQPLNHVWLFVAPWTVALPAPLSMEFSKNTGVGFFLQGIFPTRGSNLHLLLGWQILYHWSTDNKSFCKWFRWIFYEEK